jgi:hypothetical protein
MASLGGPTQKEVGTNEVLQKDQEKRTLCHMLSLSPDTSFSWY